MPHELTDVRVEGVAGDEQRGKTLGEAGGAVPGPAADVVATRPRAGEGLGVEPDVGAATWAAAPLQAQDGVAELRRLTAQDVDLAAARQVGEGLDDHDTVEGQDGGRLLGPGAEEVGRADDQEPPDRPRLPGIGKSPPELGGTGRGVQKV